MNWRRHSGEPGRRSWFGHTKGSFTGYHRQPRRQVRRSQRRHAVL
ncbi:MAG: hypothetical protein R3C16_12605 [Hyphomonadaceae bacterium]